MMTSCVQDVTSTSDQEFSGDYGDKRCDRDLPTDGSAAR